MFRLLDLSPELFVQIVDFLPHVDILNIALVCKSVNRITIPQQCREFTSSRVHQRGFKKFLNYIIKYPERAKYFKKVCLRPWCTVDALCPHDWHAEYFDPRPTQPSEMEYISFCNAASTCGLIQQVHPYKFTSYIMEKGAAMFSGELDADTPWHGFIYSEDLETPEVPFDDRFCQNLLAGLDDAPALLILSLLPNIQELLIQAAPSDRKALPFKIPQHGFKYLKHFTAQPENTGTEWALGYFNEVHQAPNLMSLEVKSACSFWPWSDVGEEPETLCSIGLSPNTSNVHRLVLHDCALGVDDLKSILNASPLLESFFFQSDVEPLSNIAPAPTPEILIELLRPHKDRLEELYLSLKSTWASTRPSVHLRSLTDFVHLKSLDTQMGMWHDSSLPDNPSSAYETHLSYRLPPSLRRLVFHSVIGDVTGKDRGPIASLKFRNLITVDREERLPNLQSVVIESDNPAYRKRLRRYRKLDFPPDGTPSPFTYRILRSSWQGTTPTIFDSLYEVHETPSTEWSRSESKYVRLISESRARIQISYRHAHDMERFDPNIFQTEDGIRMVEEERCSPNNGNGLAGSLSISESESERENTNNESVVSDSD
ncbi:hypothetical protein B0J11DRAFT_539280 [Dendryphion nanum]|uniref:F-box domain-containing protein n=1 Tax=Dendryphion nanum TaxID=256645 RepID=A0A9P9IE39_9PLEO|nr:hypothetical protein B0J11DRAFT_539280 [Dendryphion nanum]